MPIAPTIVAITSISKSSNIIPRESKTTPNEGSVSKPEKGGAKNANSENIKTNTPTILINQELITKPLILGLVIFSNLLMSLIRVGIVRVQNLLGSFKTSHFLGSQILFLPIIISIDSNITIISNI